MSAMKLDEKALNASCEAYDKEWLATELHSKATAAAIRAYLEAATPPDELSGNPGELIDKMADAIRGDTAPDVASLWVPANPDHKKIGWTYDFDQIERIKRAAEKATGYDATMEIIQFVMNEADRRAATALRLSAGGGEKGQWKEIEINFRLKGRRTSPAYFPATGEVCEVSGPNCDDANGYTWMRMTVLWQNEKFVLYGLDGCWPNLHKREHVLFRPLPASPTVEAVHVE